MADTQVGSNETPEGILQKNEGTTCIESLQVLTSRMPPVENTAVKSGKAVKSKLRRGRKKKKLPVKFPQPTILPKVFAIQIAPQANIIAPVTAVVNQNTLQNVASKPVAPLAYQPPVTNVAQVPSVSNKEQNVCSVKTTNEPKGKQITREESIKLAGNFQYATNNSEPTQFDLEDITTGSQGFQKLNHKRLVHNASEKRRKEKINGWINKIATVLFKHCPEKLPKIDILEKAFEFISERTQTPVQRDGKQDAFTQADPAQDQKIPDLVAKIIELENLLHSIMKVIKKCKLPIPSTIFKSAYAKKLVAAYSSNSNTVESAITLVSSTQCPVIPNESTTVVNDLHQNGTQLDLVTENSLYHGDTSMESVSQLQFQRCLSASIKQPELSSNGTPSGQVDQPSVQCDLDVVGSSIMTRGSIPEIPDMSSYSPYSSSSVPVDQRHVGISIVSSELLQSNLQQSMLTNQTSVLPLQQVNSEDTTNFSQNNTASVTPNSVHSVPQSLLNRSTVNLSNDVTVGRIEKQVVYNSTGAALSNVTSKQLKTNKETTVKPPSMESQMFVMKNLVNSRNKPNWTNYDLLANVPVPSTYSHDKPSVNATKQGLIMEGRSPFDQNGKATVPQVNRPNALVVEKGMLRSEGGLDGYSSEPSFLRFGSQLLDTSQTAREMNNEITISTCSHNAAGNISVTQSKQRPSKPSKLLLSTGICNASGADASSQQSKALGTQTGAFGIQTCHSVTSLLSGMTTSPTENSALSIDRILSDRTGSKQEQCLIRPNEQCPQTFVSNLNDQGTHKANIASRKRQTSSRAPRKQSGTQTSLQVSLNEDSMNSSKPSPKRARKNSSQIVSQNIVNMEIHEPISGQSPASNKRNQMMVNAKSRKEERSKQKRPNNIRSSGGLTLPQGGNILSLPKPHNFVSLARKHQQNRNGGNALGHFSTESLLRSSTVTNAQALVGDTDQDMSLPTILNIFAPASIGGMVSQLPMSANLSSSPSVNNSTSFPTIHSTFSNFSAEALIGGSMENNQPSVNTTNEQPLSQSEQQSLNQSEQQSLFTDFSTDALLAGTESNLSYGIDNIMSRNDVVVSNSCISPNWLQTNSLIDSSPIRGTFNQGLSIFDTPSSMQGYVSSGQNTVFTTPIKWRQDVGRNDDQNISLVQPSSVVSLGVWNQTLTTGAQKTLRNEQNKDGQKSKGTRGQPNSKRGPSFGDFLLVDSVS